MNNSIKAFQQNNNKNIGPLNVTNIYIVFKKLDFDISNNRDVPGMLKNIALHKRSSQYFNKANKDIIYYTNNIYTELAYTEFHRVIESLEGFCIEQIIDGKFILLFIKTDSELILLNYLNIYEYNKFDRYIPEHIPNIDNHIHEFEHFNSSYVAINTYEPFLKYGCYDNFKINSSLNYDFFNSFEGAFKNSYYHEGKKNICFNLDGKEEFIYYIFRNNIIITGYSINIIKDEAINNVWNSPF